MEKATVNLQRSGNISFLEKTETREIYIFVHGMFGWGYGEGINSLVPYWGATSGDLMEYLTEKGYECYAASVGPMSSAWDQACELYAQITGKAIDYGVVHSEKNSHERYGREYKKSIIKNFDEDKENIRLHLIGHSYGGMCIKTFTHLMTNGAPEEVDACENASELFKGGKEKYIKSCTTLCTPHNGSTAYTYVIRKHLKPLFKAGVTAWAGVFGRSALNGRLVDFHLEHFGITEIPGEKNASNISKNFKKFYDTNDSIDYAIGPRGAKELNDMIKISNNVYYFSYAFDSTEKVKGKYKTKNSDFFFMAMTGNAMIRLGEFTDGDSEKTFDESWLPNDGLVNVTSALYPEGNPHKWYEGEKAEKGIWNVMPVQKGDHGTAIGLFADKLQTRKFYNDIMKTLSSLE